MHFGRDPLLLPVSGYEESLCGIWFLSCVVARCNETPPLTLRHCIRPFLGSVFGLSMAVRRGRLSERGPAPSLDKKGSSTKTQQFLIQAVIY